MPRSRLRRWLLVAILALAPLELIGHRLIISRVPDAGDWLAAARFVEEEGEARDGVLAAPRWTSPLWREASTRPASFADAARSDIDHFERLWVTSIRGHRASEAPERAPDLSRRFGGVTVQRWDLPEPSILHDLTENIRRAEVSLQVDGRPRPCPWRETVAQGGRLGGGPMRPRGAFVCDRQQPWVWVGETVNEDLELRPRHCIWQHPSAKGPVRAEFDDIPLGERIVLYAGIYYEHERHLEGGPVTVRVEVNGRPLGSLVHHDGDGWQRLELPIEAEPGARGTVAIEVVAPDPHRRSICWSATTRGAPREGER